MKAGASRPRAEPPVNITRYPRYRPEIQKFGQAADKTRPSQESPFTILQPLPTQGDAIGNHTCRVIEITGTASANRRGDPQQSGTSGGDHTRTLYPSQSPFSSDESTPWYCHGVGEHIMRRAKIADEPRF
jgi:hypothetical protein